jgi:pimeloyl-ACP methyl ester carboxylesterase
MIEAPTLILKADASSKDRVADREVVREMDNVSVVHIDGAGHNLHHDELEVTVNLMTVFLSNLSASNQ